jgi:protein-L-isoaspartate(D-aspartate) O-methyltransferase
MPMQSKHASSHLHAHMRFAMVAGQLVTNRVLDERVLAAILSVPREEFVPEKFCHCAYADEDLLLVPGRYLMEPLIFARLTQAANIKAEDRVLDICCATGYSSIVLGKLAKEVIALEGSYDLAERAAKHVARLKMENVRVQVGSPNLGYAASAPYDVIIIEGAVEQIPEAISSQLARDGRLVAIQNKARRPDFRGGLGRGILMTRVGGTFQTHEMFDASAAVLPGFEQKASFTF